MKRAILVLALVALWPREVAAQAVGVCKPAAENELKLRPEVDVAFYWKKGAAAPEQIKSAGTAPVDQIIYFLGDPAFDAQIATLPVAVKPPDGFTATDGDVEKIVATKKCKGLLARTFVVGGAPTAEARADVSQARSTPVTPFDALVSYRQGDVVRNDGTIDADSAYDIAAEAIQILGQIVVDRASQAAYEMIGRKVRGWLRCKDDDTSFEDTCRALENLRLQDLAMAPSVLGAGLASDVMKMVGAKRDDDKKTEGTKDETSSVLHLQPVFAADDEATPTRDLDPIAILQRSIQKVILPLLGRPQEAITARTAETLIRDLVQQGLELFETKVTEVEAGAVEELEELATWLEETAESIGGALGAEVKILVAEVKKLIAEAKDEASQKLEEAAAKLKAAAARLGGELTTKALELVAKLKAKAVEVKQQIEAAYCGLEPRERVLATAALSFAVCELRDSDAACPILEIAARFDATCEPADRLTSDQLAHVASIAGNLEDAVSMKKEDNKPDLPGRLRAGASAVFDVACMYAVADEAGPYLCDVEDGKQGELGDWEKVAVMRDVTHAAIDRDGQALVAAVVRALVRATKHASQEKERRGLRVLATIAGYAATYTTQDDGSGDAHKQRTKLLESLTRDMTDRTDRDGDTIFSIGGSLRAVAGARRGHSQHMEQGPTAFWGPLSLTLGFGVHGLRESSRGGFHVELSLVDLGGYLSWEEGGQLATPDLRDAFAPAITVGGYWGREIPFFLGVTAGLSPGFDFDRDSEDDRRGAFNIGITGGAYVPLFDLN